MNKLTKILPMILLLVGCSHINDNSSNYISSSNQISSLNTNSDSSSTNSSDVLSSSSYTSSNNYSKIERNLKNTYYTLGENQGIPYLQSTGNQKILVVPVAIKGYENNVSEKIKNDIKLAFFGNLEEVEYESVASYYNKSSYNLLNISGKVTNWYESNLSLDEVCENENDLLNQVCSWYKENNSDFKDFDVNNDGLFDAIWMIYNVPSEEINVNFSCVTSNLPIADFSSPLAGIYCSSSYDYIYKGYGEEYIDSHTYIHETGHMLGLTDYYDTSGNSYVRPMAFLDMMDGNIGDHSAFSKYSLGWVEPYLVEGDCVITINNFQESGDCIIIKPQEEFNNTPFDEYIMLELISPKGVNIKDSSIGYLNNYNYQEAGVRILHIDARAVNSNGKIVNDINEMQTTKFTNTPVAAPGYCDSTNFDSYMLSTLISKNFNVSSNVLGNPKYVASDGDLFKEDDIFDLKTGSKYRNIMPSHTNKYNKGGFFKYELEFLLVDEDSATISFKTY